MVNAGLHGIKWMMWQAKEGNCLLLCSSDVDITWLPHHSISFHLNSWGTSIAIASIVMTH